jgi:hypothetical protein
MKYDRGNEGMILTKKIRNSERKAPKPQALTIDLPKIPHGLD